MTIEELVGNYIIKGHNQDASHSSYEGKLSISLDHHKRVVAVWNIGDDQVQQGMGFFKDQILVINFSYTGVDDSIFKGVVVYKCLTSDFLEGFWSEDAGDPLFLGIERAYRVLASNNTLLN